MKQRTNNIFRDSATAFVYKISGLAIGYIFTILITRNLGAEALGIYALATTLHGISTKIGNFGLNTALLRFITEFSTRNRNDLIKTVYLKSLQFLVPLSLVITILLYGFSSTIASVVFNKPLLAPSFRIIAFAIMPTILIMINLESLRALKAIKHYLFLQNIAQALTATVVLFVLLYWRHDRNIPVQSFVISQFIVVVCTFVIWLRVFDIRQPCKQNDIGLPSLFKVSVPLLFY